MAKLTQKQLAALRAEYLAKREELLIKKVDALAVKLFEKIYEKYLVNLESVDGKLLASDKNFNIVKGLDEIYNSFVRGDNIPVVKGFVKDLQGIVPLNARYFGNLTDNDLTQTTKRVAKAVDKSLGLDEDGKLKPGGYADRVIRDKTVLKSIKKATNQALTSRAGFQEFRQDLKTLIQGDPKIEGTGKLQQYYRNIAYDSYAKVDRMNQDMYAQGLGLRYFIWSGGIIKTSRELCKYADGKTVDSLKFGELKFGDLKDKYQAGMDETWVPLDDLGGYACRHRKDYILTSVANKIGNFLTINSIIK